MVGKEILASSSVFYTQQSNISRAPEENNGKRNPEKVLGANFDTNLGGVKGVVVVGITGDGGGD